MPNQDLQGKTKDKNDSKIWTIAYVHCGEGRSIYSVYKQRHEQYFDPQKLQLLCIAIQSIIEVYVG